MMPTILIRDVPEDVVRALGQRAEERGMSREAWLREQLKALASGPAVKPAYALHYTSEAIGGENVGAVGAVGMIVRNPDDPTGQVVRGTIAGPTAAQYAAHLNAERLVALNRPGDREEALRLLRAAFSVVFEGPVVQLPPPPPVQYEKMTPEERRAWDEAHHPDRP